MTDYEADLMIAHAEIATLKRQLAESQRREKAAVGDIPRICRTCKKRSERWLSDGRMDDYCVTCGKNSKCNWQWRGPQAAGEGGIDG